MDQSKPVDERLVTLQAFGQEAQVLIGSEQTGNAFCLMRFWANPGNPGPPHSHQNEDETFIIEAGELEVKRGEDLVRGKAGDAIYLPKKIPHAPQIVGTNALQALVLCVPGGFDRFFAECAKEWQTPEPNMKELGEIAARYGIHFL
jgi:quercetin dioxygenase-like cupin family protein